MRYSVLVAFFVISAGAAFSQDIATPDFISKILSHKLPKAAGHQKVLAKDKCDQLIAYYKNLSIKNPKELERKIHLVPYLAGYLPFQDFADLAKGSIIEEYENPDALKFAFLQEMGYMALREKSVTGKAFTLLLEMQKPPTGRELLYSDSYRYNHRFLLRISRFTELYKTLLPTIDTNKNDMEMLIASMENQLANRPRKLFILNHKTEPPVVEDDTSDGLVAPPPVIVSVDSSKKDQCNNDSNEYFKMLVDVLTFPDPKVRMAAVQGLRLYTGKNFGFNPVGPESERKIAVEKWKRYVSEHDILKDRKQALSEKYRRLRKKR